LIAETRETPCDDGSAPAVSARIELMRAPVSSRSMPSPFSWAAFATTLVLACTVPAQAWTDEELEQHIQGFLEPSLEARLTQIASLVRQRDVAAPAIAARIHGDHREYLLRVQRLIDQLCDERWLERERAERELIEIGGRARSLLEVHKESGEILEQRIRCERILRQLDARGTEKEEMDVQKLRGLLATAPYLPGDERLQRALLSALGHSDLQVRAGAIRALGVHGEGEHAGALRDLLDADHTLRRVVLACVPRVRGAEALRTCAAWLDGAELSSSEKIAVQRGLRGRADAADLLQRLHQQADPLLAVAARIELPAEDEPAPVEIELTDGTHVEQRFLGLTGDAVAISSPVEGLDRVEIPFGECRSLRFHPGGERPSPGLCRVFLARGSLLLGKLIGFADGVLRLDTERFGELRIPRASLQGIALDPAADRLIGASTQNDRVRLQNQKLIDGECIRITADEIVLRDSQGDRAIRAGEAAGVIFKRPPASTDRDLYSRVDVAGGDRLLCHIAAAHASAVGIVVPDVGTAVLPLRDITRMEIEVNGGALWGFTLISDYGDNRVLEVDERGNEVFVMNEVYGAWDAECLDNGNLLITEFSASRVQEVTRSGETVWSYTALRNPYDADRLPNGNTLIANTFAGQVIEVSPQGGIVWSQDAVRPFDAERLENGNTLIADQMKERVIEVTPAKEIVWEMALDAHGSRPNVHDADRLPNGNTLITLRNANRVIEVDAAKREVFRLDNLVAPSDADRLPNGNTLVAENGMVREFDPSGAVVWRKEVTWSVEANRY
jgi:hypothetical protein